MKTILFLLEFTSLSGGMCQSVLSLAEGLAQTGRYKIYIISPNESEISKYPFNDNVINITTRNTDWTISRNTILKLISTSFEISQIIKKNVPSDTLIITNNVGGSIVASFVNIFIRVKEVYVNRGGSFQESGLGPILMRRKLKKGKFYALIATSKRQKNILKQFSDDTVTIIPNGLPTSDLVHEFTPLSKDKLVIGSIGYISDIKNYAEGVKTIQILRDSGINAVLNIYGKVGSPSDQEYYDKLIKLIKECNLENYINFKGFVKGNSKFDESDIIVSFSKTEGFGRTLVEAMLCLKPVIAWRGAGGPIDITNDGKCGFLVERNDAIDYANIISKLISNPDKLKEITEKGYYYALENFTVEKMVENYDSLFNML